VRLYRTAGWWQSRVAYTWRDFIEVQVTFTYGYDVAPEDLKSWSIALALQAMPALSTVGTMGTGNVQSVKIDDYSVTYAAGGEAAAGWSVPEPVGRAMRASYGGGAQVVRGGAEVVFRG
jgi:hypothetical protein